MARSDKKGLSTSGAWSKFPRKISWKHEVLTMRVSLGLGYDLDAVFKCTFGRVGTGKVNTELKQNKTKKPPNKPTPNNKKPHKTKQ